MKRLIIFVLLAFTVIECSAHPLPKELSIEQKRECLRGYFKNLPPIPPFDTTNHVVGALSQIFYFLEQNKHISPTEEDMLRLKRTYGDIRRWIQLRTGRHGALYTMCLQINYLYELRNGLPISYKWT